MLINSSLSPIPPKFKLFEPLNSDTLNSKKALDKNTDTEQQSSSSNVNSGSESESITSQENLSEQRALQELIIRDREVRAHEMAHAAVGGQYVTSGAQFSYQKGSNGKLYAVAGEVSINTAEIPGDPKATLLKAQTIARAALAPANPSAQDRNVAAQATVLIQQARIDLASLMSESSAKDVGQNIDAFA